MKEADIAQIVSGLSYTLKRQGVNGDECFIVDPMELFLELKRLRPDVVNHLERRYNIDPYQKVKDWIPSPMTYK